MSHQFGLIPYDGITRIRFVGSASDTRLVIASYLSLWPVNGRKHPVKNLKPNTNGVGLT